MTASAAQRAPLDPREEIETAKTEILSGNPAAGAVRLEALIAQITAPIALYWLSAAYGAMGDHAKQKEYLRRAQREHGARMIKDAGGDMKRLQTDAAYAFHVGIKFYEGNQMGPAAVACGLAASDQNPAGLAVIQYGLALQHQGRIEEAIDVFTFATERFPGAGMHDFLLYACFFAEGGAGRHATEVRRWAKLYAPPYDPKAYRFANVRNADRKLKIGYVAPSFVGTQVRQFLLPSLYAHDPDAFDIHLYAANGEAEQGLPGKIVTIGRMKDAEAVARIRDDRIDVLVDLWGHTSKGRLGVFARKAAPVQVSWINYIQSTGLKTMDYVFHADCMAVPGTAELFSEKVWSLGPILAPFRPDWTAPAHRAPALRNGYVTFGCFNHPAKISEQTIAAWARILKAAPDARLVLKYSYYADPVLQNTMCVRFAAHGVGPEQLQFRGHSSGEDYVKQFADIDIALDPSPCPGGTTSCDAIASGVPLLALRGQDFYARLALVHLEPLGFPELIAETWDDYVDKAVSLTRDHEALDQLRDKMRSAFWASPFRDEAGFTRRLESAYRAMFAKWCEGA